MCLHSSRSFLQLRIVQLGTSKANLKIIISSTDNDALNPWKKTVYNLIYLLIFPLEN